MGKGKRDTLRPQQNGGYFADNIFKCALRKMLIFLSQFDWSLFQRVQLKIIQHWFRTGIDLVPKQATSHYLNQWWGSSMMLYDSNRPQWVKPTVMELCLFYINPLPHNFINPRHAEFIFIISQNSGGSCCWNPSSWKTRTSLFCKANTMAADARLLVLPGHQQPWYWPNSTKILWFQHQQGWYYLTI